MSKRSYRTSHTTLGVGASIATWRDRCASPCYCTPVECNTNPPMSAKKAMRHGYRPPLMSRFPESGDRLVRPAPPRLSRVSRPGSLRPCVGVTLLCSPGDFAAKGDRIAAKAVPDCALGRQYNYVKRDLLALISTSGPIAVRSRLTGLPRHYTSVVWTAAARFCWVRPNPSQSGLGGPSSALRAPGRASSPICAGYPRDSLVGGPCGALSAGLSIRSSGTRRPHDCPCTKRSCCPAWPWQSKTEVLVVMRPAFEARSR